MNWRGPSWCPGKAPLYCGHVSESHKVIAGRASVLSLVHGSLKQRMSHGQQSDAPPQPYLALTLAQEDTIIRESIMQNPSRAQEDAHDRVWMQRHKELLELTSRVTSSPTGSGSDPTSVSTERKGRRPSTAQAPALRSVEWAMETWLHVRRTPGILDTTAAVGTAGTQTFNSPLDHHKNIPEHSRTPSPGVCPRERKWNLRPSPRTGIWRFQRKGS